MKNIYSKDIATVMENIIETIMEKQYKFMRIVIANKFEDVNLFVKIDEIAGVKLIDWEDTADKWIELIFNAKEYSGASVRFGEIDLKALFVY